MNLFQNKSRYKCMLTRYKLFYPIGKNSNINPDINFILSFQWNDRARKFYTIIIKKRYYVLKMRNNLTRTVSKNFLFKNIFEIARNESGRRYKYSSNFKYFSTNAVFEKLRFEREGRVYAWMKLI